MNHSPSLARAPRRRAAAAAIAATAVLAGTAACGVPERVVGLHAAPTESLSGAPYGEPTAQEITGAVLAKADAALAAEKVDAKALGAVLTGPALTLAKVNRRFVAEGADPLAAPGSQQILAISAGRDWPRSILATTLENGVQRLHLLISAKPTQPYKLWISAAMEPGAIIPALPPLETGTTVVAKADGLIAAPGQIFAVYSQFLDHPTKKKSSSVVTAKDAFADGIRASSAAQVKALGKLGTFKRANKVAPDSLIAVRLADGSALAFGQVTREDTLKPTSKAKRLDLPSNLAKLARTKSVTKSMRLHWLQTLVAVIPATKPATVIGASEQLTGLSAS